MILIAKHIDIEGPGTFGDFLKERKLPFTIVELGSSEKLPRDLKEIQAVVVLGGPMNVYEEDKYPFLKEENRFIQNVVQEEIPYLGICLGSQLLAKACGAPVVKSPVKEVGWYKIRLTPDGKKDLFLKGFDPKIDIYHWHEDMFQIPSNGVLLATSDGCPHQTFRVGKNAYGIQFHIEVTDKSIKEWSDEYCQKDLPGRQEQRAAMLEGYAKNKEAFRKQAFQIYNNFLELIRKEK